MKLIVLLIMIYSMNAFAMDRMEAVPAPVAEAAKKVVNSKNKLLQSMMQVHLELSSDLLRSVTLLNASGSYSLLIQGGGSFQYNIADGWATEKDLPVNIKNKIDNKKINVTLSINRGDIRNQDYMKQMLDMLKNCQFQSQDILAFGNSGAVIYADGLVTMDNQAIRNLAKANPKLAVNITIDQKIGCSVNWPAKAAEAAAE